MNPFGLVVVDSLGRRAGLAQVAVVERARHGGVSILGLAGFEEQYARYRKGT